MNDSITAICAVVPAHNDQTTLSRCVAALVHAARYTRPQLPEVRVRIVIVADACTDDTARTLLGTPGIDVLTIRAHNRARARRKGVNFALDALALHPRYTPATSWVTTVDATHTVPEHWLADQINQANTGSDVFLEPLSDGGPSLGVRASSYRTAGGFLPSQQPEVLDLLTRLHHTHARITAA